MTLTELRYVFAVARERHFGRAAAACYVSQPTLSVGIKKLEEELGVVIFERSTNEIALTPVGEQIVAQAGRVLEEAELLRSIAQQSSDPLSHPLKIGAIYTVGPYLLPHILPLMHQMAPDMQLIIQENYTSQLKEQLRQGKLDVMIIALPIEESSICTEPLYEEPFQVALPINHEWNKKVSISAKALGQETVLLLGAGHCFRDQVLKACPHMLLNQHNGGIQQTLEGSSLETIRYMVSSGVGMTILPSTACDQNRDENRLLRFKPFTAPAPARTIALAWRKNFPRLTAIKVLKDAILAAKLHGVVSCDHKGGLDAANEAHP